MKHEFKPYLAPIMECLMADAKRDVDLRIVDMTEDDDEEEDKNKVKLEVNIKG